MNNSSERSSSLDPQRVSGRRLWVFLTLFTSLSALGFYAIYDQYADAPLQLDRQLLSPGLLAAVAGLLLIYFASDGLRLYFTIRALNHRLPARHVLRLVFINIFFSNITPMATGGGVAQVWYMHRYGIPIGIATAATTIRTTLSMLLIFGGAAASILLFDHVDRSMLDDGAQVYLVLFLTIYLGFFAVLLWRTHWLLPPLALVLHGSRRLRLMGKRRHRRLHFRARRELLRFSKSFGRYIRGPKHHVLLSILFTVIFLLSLFSFPALLIAGLGYNVQYLTVLGLLVITTFIMYFSPTPGASGIAEGVFGHFFVAILGAGHLLLVTVLWRALTIYLGMVLGFFIMHNEVVSKRKRHAST